MAAEPGHPQLRFRRTAVAGIAYQAVVSLYQLLIPALLSRQFGGRVLGLWMTAYSLFGLFLAADLGVPATLLTTMHSAGTGHETVNASLVRSGLLWTLVYVTGPLLFAALSPALPWARWFGPGWPAAVGEAGPLVAWLLLLAALSVFASLAQPICLAVHRGYQAYVISATVYLVAIPALLIAAWLRARFFVLAALFVAPPLLGGGALWLWGLTRRWFTVARRTAPGEQSAFWHVGAQFLLTDVVASLIVRTPEAILSRTHGFAAAGRYSVITRFPFLLNAVLVVVLQQLWPSFVAATRAMDEGKVRLLVRRAYGTALALWLAFAIFVAAFGKFLVRKWLGGDAEGSATLLPFGVALALVQSLHYCTSLVLVGVGGRRQNLHVSAVMLVAYLALAAVLAPRGGAAGVFVTLIAVFGLIGAPLSYFSGRRLRRGWTVRAPQGDAS